MLSTERRHKPYSECHNQFIGKEERAISRKWCSRLAASVVRFDAVRLFPMLLRQVYGLCQQASDDLCLKIVKNWVQRLDFCKRPNGGHVKEIDFYS